MLLRIHISSRGIKVLACLLYMYGLSYRSITYQTGLIGASRVAVFHWVHALEGMVSKVRRRETRLAAMDETKVKLQGSEVFVWDAIDVDTKELLSLYALYRGSYINTLVFARMVLETRTNRRVILVDRIRGIRGSWRGWG